MPRGVPHRVLPSVLESHLHLERRDTSRLLDVACVTVEWDGAVILISRTDRRTRIAPDDVERLRDFLTTVVEGRL